MCSLVIELPDSDGERGSGDQPQKLHAPDSTLALSYIYCAYGVDPFINADYLAPSQACAFLTISG